MFSSSNPPVGDDLRELWYENRAPDRGSVRVSAASAAVKLYPGSGRTQRWGSLARSDGGGRSRVAAVGGRISGPPDRTDSSAADRGPSAGVSLRPRTDSGFERKHLAGGRVVHLGNVRVDARRTRDARSFRCGTGRRRANPGALASALGARTVGGLGAAASRRRRLAMLSGRRNDSASGLRPAAAGMEAAAPGRRESAGGNGRARRTVRPYARRDPERTIKNVLLARPVAARRTAASLSPGCSSGARSLDWRRGYRTDRLWSGGIG